MFFFVLLLLINLGAIAFDLHSHSFQSLAFHSHSLSLSYRILLKILSIPISLQLRFSYSGFYLLFFFLVLFKHFYLFVCVFCESGFVIISKYFFVCVCLELCTCNFAELRPIIALNLDLSFVCGSFPRFKVSFRFFTYVCPKNRWKIEGIIFAFCSAFSWRINLIVEVILRSYPTVNYCS